MGNSTRAFADAWYDASRPDFVAAEPSQVIGKLLNSAVEQGWHVEEEQRTEWESSVDLLRRDLSPALKRGVTLLRDTLHQIGLESISDVILEYNFRRRGLRIDCILLAPGLICVLEFKRTALTASDHEQVLNYCINLLEFHSETRRLCDNKNVIVVPLLVLTQGRTRCGDTRESSFFPRPWGAVVSKPVLCDAANLRDQLECVIGMARSECKPNRVEWLRSEFRPSSTILDAAISLYGQHDVSSIRTHDSSVSKIDDCIDEVATNIVDAQRLGQNRIVFVSGAPGSGKTLVGLRLAFDPRLRDDSVFVTGNAPLVEVLTEALRQSYRHSKSTSAAVAAGYPRDVAKYVLENAVFKIVKAHNFLAARGKHTASSDGRVIIFDEAQRTYEKGRIVQGAKLEDHEADLILQSLEKSYKAGIVVVALVGQNQAINRGERGPVAWFEAAERRGWAYAVSDSTFDLSDFAECSKWKHSHSRLQLSIGHLSESLRFYRNSSIEQWTHALLKGETEHALLLAQQLQSEGHSIGLTRDLSAARSWARARRVGETTAGVVASGQARRLAAEGLFVDHKPSIANWMLKSAGDVRSCSMMETVQNQYQVQGLELDYVIACWDLDLRREGGEWAAYKLNGTKWQKDREIEIAKNGYRVLLTRARRGMVVFVPLGDLSGHDTTRCPDKYEAIANYLVSCGAKALPETTNDEVSG